MTLRVLSVVAFVVTGCGSLVTTPDAAFTMPGSATNGPRVLNCEFLLSPRELEGWIGTRVESVLVSYGDGAGCQYHTGRGAAHVTVFTGPNAEEMWANRPSGAPGPPGTDVNIVDGQPVVHMPGRWLTLGGSAFDAVPLDRRVELATLLVSRL